MTNLLFVCTYGLQRSPTAEQLFARCGNFKTASAGTSIMARHHVTQELISWADIIFVMSEKDDQHETILRKKFTIGDAPLYDLDIDDRFLADQTELKYKLIERVARYVDISSCRDALLADARK